MRRLFSMAAVVLLLAALAACGSGQSGSKQNVSPTPQTLTVYAAASLTQTFTALGKQFQKDHPGVKVTFSFGGSSDLVAQLEQGAPADVFASADTRNMDKAVTAGLLHGKPVDFASNTLQIAVPPSNPHQIHSLADLAKPGLKVVVCAPQVPCGAATVKVERAAHVHLKPVSEEQSVTDVLTKVQTGEADAGLVYVTDVKGSAGKVTGVTFPEATHAVNTYPIATLQDSKHAALARQFVELVTGVTGQSVLSAAGFGKP